MKTSHLDLFLTVLFEITRDDEQFKEYTHANKTKKCVGLSI